jgi:OFA family oxalate/formate antiporter-like MFS transporter
VVGYLSDRYSARAILAGFTFALAAGAMLMSTARSVLSASLVFSIAGLGHAACWAPVVALIQKWAPDSKRGTVLAFATLGSGSGVALWSLLLPLIVAGSGWRTAWIGMGSFACVVAALNFLLVRNPPEEEPNSRSLQKDGRPPRTTLSSYRFLLRNKTLWLVGLSYSLVGFTVLVPYTYLGTFATEQLHVDYSLAALSITVVAVCGILGKIVIGTLSDHLGRVPMMMASNLLLGAGCAGLAFCSSRHGLFSFAGLFGFGFGAVWPLYAAAAPDFFPKKKRRRHHRTVDCFSWGGIHYFSNRLRVDHR